MNELSQRAPRGKSGNVSVSVPFARGSPLSLLGVPWPYYPAPNKTTRTRILSSSKNVYRQDRPWARNWFVQRGKEEQIHTYILVHKGQCCMAHAIRGAWQGTARHKRLIPAVFPRKGNIPTGKDRHQKLSELLLFFACIYFSEPSMISSFLYFFLSCSLSHSLLFCFLIHYTPRLSNTTFSLFFFVPFSFYQGYTFRRSVLLIRKTGEMGWSA